MANDTLVLMIDENGDIHQVTTEQLLAAMYGAGLVAQGRIAGEYPPPPVDVPNCPVDLSADAESRALAQGSGVARTITGRFSRSEPPFHEIEPQTRSLAGKAFDERTRDLVKTDFSKIEERILAHMDTPPQDMGRFDCSGNYRWPMGYEAGPQKLRQTSINISQMLKQAEVSGEKLAEWQEVLRQAGFRQAGDGPLSDTWIKEDEE